jgi:hypothetical protein
MRSRIAIAAVVVVVAAVMAGPGMATTGKGFLFHDGAVVGTVVVPAHVAPGSGSDPFFNVTNGADGQLGIAAVAPGDGPYHGGDWQVWLVTFNSGVTPYLLTSDEAVFAAEAAGDVTVTRAPDADFRCPIT